MTPAEVFPEWSWPIVVALAAWRTFQLLAFDDILDQPRRYVTRLGKRWEKEGDPVPKEYREKWALFITCPYCAGFWITTVWWTFFLIWPTQTLWPASFFAVHAGMIAGHKLLSSE